MSLKKKRSINFIDWANMFKQMNRVILYNKRNCKLCKSRMPDVKINHELMCENNRIIFIILNRVQCHLVNSVCNHELNNIFKHKTANIFLTMTIDLMNMIFRYSKNLAYRNKLIHDIKHCENIRAREFLKDLIENAKLNNTEWFDFFCDVILTDCE